MDSRERNNFRACSQSYEPDLGFHDVGHDADPMNAMDGNEENNLRIWNFGGNPKLAQKRSIGHGHSGYKAYAMDLGTWDDANTSEFEYMSTHIPRQACLMISNHETQVLIILNILTSCLHILPCMPSGQLQWAWSEFGLVTTQIVENFVWDAT